MPTVMGYDLSSNFSKTIFSIFLEIPDCRLWAVFFDVVSNHITSHDSACLNKPQLSIFSSSLLTVISMISITEMFALYTSVLNTSVSEVSYLHLDVKNGCLFSWILPMLYCEMKSKGYYLLKKVILFRHYGQYEKKHYGMVNSSNFYIYYIYFY